VHTLVEKLLGRIDMLRDEKHQVERALIHEENEKMRLRDEILWHKEGSRRREDSSRYENKEHYHKKRKEREYERLLPDDYEDRDLRSYQSARNIRKEYLAFTIELVVETVITPRAVISTASRSGKGEISPPFFIPGDGLSSL